jgi:hypothetical protein
MLVEIRGKVIDLPPAAAQLLIEEGRATAVETATLSPSDGSQTPPGPRQVTAARPRKS